MFAYFTTYVHAYLPMHIICVSIARNFQDFQDEHQVHTHLHAPKDGRSSLSYPSSEDSNPSTSNSNPSGENTIPTMDKHRHEKAGKDHHLDDIHPFIRSKPPFGHMVGHFLLYVHIYLVMLACLLSLQP